MFSHARSTDDEEVVLRSNHNGIASSWRCQLHLLPFCSPNIELDTDVVGEDEDAVVHPDHLDGIPVEEPVGAGDEELLRDVGDVLPLQDAGVLYCQRLVARLDGQVQVETEHTSLAQAVVSHWTESVDGNQI